MMKKQRRKFTKEFKLQVVLEALKERLTLSFIFYKNLSERMNIYADKLLEQESSGSLQRLPTLRLLKSSLGSVQKCVSLG
jgi:hypothetical protein